MSVAARVIPMRCPAGDVLAEWAAFYARLGLRVLPVHVVRGGRCSCGKSAEKAPDHIGPGKHPRFNDWQNAATADISQVAAWWSQWPESSIGVLCDGGLVAFDVDGRNGGHETWDTIMAAHNLPACPFTITGDGLRFFMFDPTGKVKVSHSKLGPGVDVIAGGGGQCLMPPSIHPSGRRYRWAKGHDLVSTRGLLRIPQSLLDELAPNTGARSGTSVPRQTPRPSPRGSLPTPYGRAALDGLLRDIATAGVGDRWPAIYRAAARAGEIIRGGHLDSVSTFDALVDAGLAVAGDKYTETDIARAVRDGIVDPSKGGMGGAA